MESDDIVLTDHRGEREHVAAMKRWMPDCQYPEVEFRNTAGKEFTNLISICRRQRSRRCIRVDAVGLIQIAQHEQRFEELNGKSDWNSDLSWFECRVRRN